MSLKKDSIAVKIPGIQYYCQFLGLKTYLLKKRGSKNI